MQNARAYERLDGESLAVSLAGKWRITESRPAWSALLGSHQPKRVRVDVAAVERWDSSLLLFLWEANQWCQMSGAYFDQDALPEKMRGLLAQFAASHASSVPFDRSRSFVDAVGKAAIEATVRARDFANFVGECVLGAFRVLAHPRKFRWGDCIDEMQNCGAMALPIVSLISYLTGVTLAYTGAIVLRQYGADIFVADLIGLAVVREMGAVMTGVVLAGRTGAAFAATLGNMKANEEIDALETLGISPINFLVLPRLLALAVMMPLLALYANALGVLGGMTISYTILNIPPAAYWVEMGTSVSIGDISVGLIKACAFGLIVGLSGCLRGFQAERSAAGVGLAATSAVVTSILLIVVGDALFAVLFNAVHL
jgi:phospholipid/cholesterol/gamma-HCH transport system permease protein